MKVLFCIAASVSVVGAFLAPTSQEHGINTVRLQQTSCSSSAESSQTNRKDFIKTVSMVGVSAIIGATGLVEPASARGRATLEKTYERYAPRIKAGGDFYANELRALVAKDDFAGIKAALAEPPSRASGDLSKPDAGVGERARLAGGFSDARVLVAADLFGAAFSESSITPKTKRIQAAVAKERSIILEMQSVAKQALGEESVGGGLFGLGAKKPSAAESSKKMKELYVQGGNAWNDFVLATNDNLALQFDRFEYVK